MISLLQHQYEEKQIHLKMEKEKYNDVDISELNFIRDKIELMPKFNHVEILRLLNKYDCVTLNENKNGVHINLTEIPKCVIEELLIYISYVSAQENNLNIDEIQKENFKNIYFIKDNKDNTGKYK